MNPHDAMLEDVAAYAVGALAPNDAAGVRRHLETCVECREEYRGLRPVVDALAYSAEACDDPAAGAVVVSPRLKQRVMREVRRDAGPALPSNVGEMRAVRPVVWPAYAVAAACLAIALVSTIFNITLSEESHAAHQQIAQLTKHEEYLNREAATVRQAAVALAAADSQHFPVENGEVVRHGNRLFIAMSSMNVPPRGKVYQAWTLKSGDARMSPSVTFVPDAAGVAVVPLPVPASNIVAVAVSVEPDGGSKQPTSKPAFVVKLI